MRYACTVRPCHRREPIAPCAQRANSGSDSINVLVLNCGSSSLKFQLLETGETPARSDSERCLARGYLERIGGQSLIGMQLDEGRALREVVPLRDHRAAVDHVLRWLVSDACAALGLDGLGSIHAVGHRVVHGGERFRAHVLIDRTVIEGIEECIELAPLHNPANLKGIQAASALLGQAVPQVAVFDTAFHASMPESSFLYPIPYQYYRRHRVRRYGFHGTSHEYLALRYAELTERAPEAVNIITLHLGNGCSACAIRGGRSFMTSMGFTPLEGLMMGTRSGDLDPSIIEFLMHKEGLSVAEVDSMLNRHSGLLGVSGLTSDMRELIDEYAENQDRRVGLAIEMFCRRAVRCVGGYLADMGGAEAVVFSAGIGENAVPVRERICEGLAPLGLEFDRERNLRIATEREGVVTTPRSRLAAWVIPTNEELLIARATARLIGARS